MLSKNLFLLSLVASINAIPVPVAQTPDFSTLDTCPKNGAIVCSPDGNKFYLCNFGRAVPMGAVAAGTKCMDGKIVTMGASMAPTMMEPEPTMMPSYAPEPTTVELVKSTTAAEVEPTQSPVDTPKPESSEEVTSTITTTKDVKVTSTSTILVTMTGSAPDAPAETSNPEPVPTSDPATGSGIAITADIILKIAPDAKSCPRNNDNGNLAPEECATAEHAAPFITEAFAKYNINTIGEAAAILSLMLFETGNFQFDKNHFSAEPYPNGNPGQGTRNMMSPIFVTQYAQTFGSTDSVAPGLTPENIGNQTPEIRNKVLDLVRSDDKSFASGAWYYTTHPACATVMPSLQKSEVSIQDWKTYLTQCINTDAEDARRRDVFERTIKVLGGTTVA